MPLKPGSSKETVSQNISEFHTGKTYAKTAAKFGKAKANKQAIAVALSTARKYKANGGGVNMEKLEIMGASRSLQREGMLHSSVPGRTDKLPLNVPAGSYVLPADIPSALGQGNTMAGGEILKKMFTSGPYGLPAPHIRSGRPHMPRLNLNLRVPRRQEGGETGEEGGNGHVPIIAAGGEYIIHPDAVKDIGHGDIKAGHKVLDKFVLSIRKKNIKILKNLPGPKQ